MNITYDLETLGNTSQAPIIQIAAVKFNDEGDIIGEFTENIKWSSLEKFDFKVDYSTLNWWFNQPDSAIKSVCNQEGAIALRLALMNFTKWLGKSNEYYYWSHATFDPPILDFNFKQVKLNNPIPYRLNRDIRTLTHFTGIIEVPRIGIHHNALDDCKYQARYISKGIRQIKTT